MENTVAASSLQLYTLLYIGINGTLLAEEQEIDLARTTNSQAISTVAKGYAGESPGAQMIEVDCSNAIPAGGFEFDMGKSMFGLIPIDVQVDGPGGTQLRGKAFVISDTIRHGVNQEAKYSFKARMSGALFS
jgi:hypothetical protein